jgi:hypothetical protein
MSSSVQTFNLTVFTDVTKKLCMCLAISIFIIFLFIISPLSILFKTALFMKILVLIILCYTIYLNIIQTKSLNSALLTSHNKEINSQLYINLICSYVFTIFIGLLLIFVIRSLF